MAQRPLPSRERLRAGPLHAILEAIVPAENPAIAIYGVLTIGALLAAETAIRESYIDAAGTTLIAAGLYWLAHGYATMVARCIAGEERLGFPALARGLRHDAAILSGAAVPLIAIAVCWLTGGSQSTAVSAAVWSTLACLVLFELLAGLRSSSTVGELIFGVGVGLAMGAGILALRIILH
jgi:hypothetical protein